LPRCYNYKYDIAYVVGRTQFIHTFRNHTYAEMSLGDQRAKADSQGQESWDPGFVISVIPSPTY